MCYYDYVWLRARPLLSFPVPAVADGLGLAEEEEGGEAADAVHLRQLLLLLHIHLGEDHPGPALSEQLGRLGSGGSTLSLISWAAFALELETKVHPKVRNHGEGPYY